MCNLNPLTVNLSKTLKRKLIMTLSKSYITAISAVALIISWFIFNNLNSKEVVSQPTNSLKIL